MNHVYSRDRERLVFSAATALALHFLAIIMLELFDWRSRIDESKLSAPIVVELADTEERNPGPKVEQRIEKPVVRQEAEKKPEPQPAPAPAVPQQTAVAKAVEPPKPQPAPQPKAQPQPKVETAPVERNYAELVEKVAPVEQPTNRTRPRIERAPAVEPKNNVQVPNNLVQGSAEQTAQPSQPKPQVSAPAAAPAQPQRDLGLLDRAIQQSMTQAPGSASQSGGSRSGPVASASSGSSGPVSDDRYPVGGRGQRAEDRVPARAEASRLGRRGGSSAQARRVAECR